MFLAPGEKYVDFTLILMHHLDVDFDFVSFLDMLQSIESPTYSGPTITAKSWRHL